MTSECITVKCRETVRNRWIKANGPLRSDEWLCHNCDNGYCVNFSHIYVGNASTNNNDAASRKRYPQQHRLTGPCGHPLDGIRQNWNGKEKRYCLECNRARSAAAYVKRRATRV